MKPQGSQGLAAIEAARLAVRSYAMEPAARPPAYDYRLSGKPPANGSPPRSRPAADHMAGPIELAAAQLRANQTTSEELVRLSLDAVARWDPELNAISYLNANGALAEAAECDREARSGNWRGPLHGIPLTVKDVIDVTGMPTRAGSAAYQRLPSCDGTAVSLLRGAGAIILGKATTHEFALGVTSPQSRNPHDPTRIPGGSSGGSAIAVKTGMGLGSLGTDTRASIRVPAALCGTVGFKPTFGSIPTKGIVPLSWTMDHISPMASTMTDAAILLDVMAPRRPIQYFAGSTIEGLSVGVAESGLTGADSRITTAVRASLDKLESLGAKVVSALRPNAADLELANAAGMLISRCEAAAFHRGLGLDRSLYWDEVADQLEAAGSVLATDYIDAQRIRAYLAQQMTEAFAGCDVLAMPTVPIVAPPVEDFSRYLLALSRNAIVWSLTGFPAVSIPCGSVDGLPVGLQLVAAPWREDQLVRLGSAVESALASE